MSFQGREITFNHFGPSSTRQATETLSAVVGGGTEFNDIDDFDLPAGISVVNADIDVGANSIIVTVDDFRFFEFATTGDFYGYVFSDESGTIPTIRGASLNPASTIDIPPEAITTTADSVSVNLKGVQIRVDQKTFIIDVQFGTRSGDPVSPPPPPPPPNDFEDVLFVARAYTATFGRDPDVEGLNFWINVFEDIGSTRDLTEFFLESGEFQERFGNPVTLDSFEFVSILYENVLRRPGDQIGIEFWQAEIDEGRLDYIGTLEAFITSGENEFNTARFEDISFDEESGLWLLA